MIRPCNTSDFETMYSIINDAAEAYHGVIPEDCWHVPYMSKDELSHETLIRHAYVRTAKQNQGIGGELLSELCRKLTRPTLVGTWADAVWAIRFYEKHGFRVVTPREKTQLLKTYWSIPDRQIDTSVVLADQRWFDLSDCH
ncbi:MAG: GNAT family N-acetyltransferase [Deltaproteobacteria bacterium]|nr:GNAT family N-acetyltransferase [Deltaproteobacteria bacterium]